VAVALLVYLFLLCAVSKTAFGVGIGFVVLPGVRMYRVEALVYVSGSNTVANEIVQRQAS
jgi:hypothetical protein